MQKHSLQEQDLRTEVEQDQGGLFGVIVSQAQKPGQVELGKWVADMGLAFMELFNVRYFHQPCPDARHGRLIVFYGDRVGG